MNAKKRNSDKASSPKLKAVQTDQPETKSGASDASDENTHKTKLVRRGAKALDALSEILEELQATDEAKTLVTQLQEQLKSLEPPPPRKCKEYRRAIQQMAKRLPGIHPDDVMRLCRCPECHQIREEAGIQHPLEPKAAV